MYRDSARRLERPQLLSAALIRSAVCLMSFTLAMMGCDDDSNGGNGDIANRSSAVLVVNPSQVDLPAIAPGETLSRTVELKNVGQAELRVVRIGFSNATNTIEFSKDHPAIPFSVAPGDSVEMTITYQPQNEGADSGSIEIESNSTPRLVTVPIRTLQGQADLRDTALQVAPAAC